MYYINNMQKMDDDYANRIKSIEEKIQNGK